MELLTQLKGYNVYKAEQEDFTIVYEFLKPTIADVYTQSNKRRRVSESLKQTIKSRLEGNFGSIYVATKLGSIYSVVVTVEDVVVTLQHVVSTAGRRSSWVLIHYICNLGFSKKEVFYKSTVLNDNVISAFGDKIDGTTDVYLVTQSTKDRIAKLFKEV